MCSVPGVNGLDELVRAVVPCDKFVARQCCTTCAYRCPPDEKEKLMPAPGKCPRWKLRKLSTWGGSRRYPKKQVCKPQKKENAR